MTGSVQFCVTFMITTEIKSPEPTTSPPPTTAAPDPCAMNNGSCSDICTSGRGGTVAVCSCYAGEQLAADGKTCKG